MSLINLLSYAYVNAVGNSGRNLSPAVRIDPSIKIADSNRTFVDWKRTRAK